MKKGYTLLEILIVLAITALLFAVGYAGFREFSRRHELESKMTKLKSDIRLAQEQALSGKKPSGCLGVLDGYKFQVSSPTNYKILSDCSGTDLEILSVNLPTYINIGQIGISPIVFKTLGQGTNIPSNQSAVITIKHLVTGNYRSIKISSTGEISDTDQTALP